MKISNVFFFLSRRFFFFLLLLYRSFYTSGTSKSRPLNIKKKKEKTERKTQKKWRYRNNQPRIYTLRKEKRRSCEKKKKKKRIRSTKTRDEWMWSSIQESLLASNKEWRYNSARRDKKKKKKEHYKLRLTYFGSAVVLKPKSICPYVSLFSQSLDI